MTSRTENDKLAMIDNWKNVTHLTVSATTSCNMRVMNMKINSFCLLNKNRNFLISCPSGT